MSSKNNKQSQTANTAKEISDMSKKTVNEQIAEHFAALAALYGAAPVESEPEEVDEDEDEEEIELTREMVDAATGEGIKALRELAESVGIESKKKADILAEFDELLGDEEDEDEDEDDEDEEIEEDDEEEEEEDEDDDEADEWTREDLEELDLKGLRKVAREDFELAAADYKGMDQDALVDFLLGEGDEEEEDDEDEDEDDEEEVEELDEDSLKAMTQKDLIGLAKELDLKVPTALKKNSAANKKKLVTLILDSGEDEE
jgi:hypothetical protein